MSGVSGVSGASDQGFRSINIADTLFTLLTFQWSINIALVCVYMYRQFIVNMSIAIAETFTVSHV